MGLKDLFHKKGTVSETARITQEVQRVDAWVMAQIPVYNLQFDATIPKSQLRAKYIAVEEQAEKYRNYKEKSEDFIRKNFYGFSGNMRNLYELYQWTIVCMTTGIQMVSAAPSSVLPSYVNLSEAASYFDHVVIKSEELCKTIAHNICETDFLVMGVVFMGEQEEEDAELIQYEDGIKKIRDCGELEQCEQLLKMLAECMKYAAHLFDVTQYIYENVPYVFDCEGNYRVIKDWKKSYENIIEHISIGNREFGTTLGEDFLRLIE